MPWLRIDVALWLVLVLVWLAAAPFARKTVRREPLSSRLRYAAPGVFVVLLMSPASPTASWLAVRWVPATSWVGVLSVALTAVGVGFALWARATLGRNWSGTVTVKEDHTLVQRGPYALARHPIYTGVLVALLGTMIGMGTAGAFLALAVVFAAFRYKMAVEERFMEEQFGAAYADYQRTVRKLIPFVW